MKKFEIGDNLSFIIWAALILVALFIIVYH